MLDKLFKKKVEEKIEEKAREELRSDYEKLVEGENNIRETLLPFVKTEWNIYAALGEDDKGFLTTPYYTLYSTVFDHQSIWQIIDKLKICEKLYDVEYYEKCIPTWVSSYSRRSFVAKAYSIDTLIKYIELQNAPPVKSLPEKE